MTHTRITSGSAKRNEGVTSKCVKSRIGGKLTSIIEDYQSHDYQSDLEVWC